MRFTIVPNKYDVFRARLNNSIKYVLAALTVLALLVLACRYAPEAKTPEATYVTLSAESLDPRTREEFESDLAYRRANALDLALAESTLHARVSTVYSHLKPPKDTALVMEEAAQKYNIDPKLLLSICVVESQLRPKVKSHAGAIGMCQIIPKWHNTTAEAMYDYVQNIDKSAEHIAELISMCNQDRSCAIQSYNLGHYGYKAGKRATVYLSKVNAEYRRTQ